MSLIEKEKNNGQNEQNLASSYIESPEVIAQRDYHAFFITFPILVYRGSR